MWHTPNKSKPALHLEDGTLKWFPNLVESPHHPIELSPAFCQSRVVEFQPPNRTPVIHRLLELLIHAGLATSLTVQVQAENSKLLLIKATLHTPRKKVSLLVKDREGRYYSWEMVAGKVKNPGYNNLITPRWKDGTLILVVMEFECGGKTVKIRTPVVPVTLT